MESVHPALQTAGVAYVSAELWQKYFLQPSLAAAVAGALPVVHMHTC